MSQKSIISVIFGAGLTCLIAPILIWVFIIVTGIGRHYKAPSASMAPTINVGEHFFVSKIGYMFSKEKIPNRGDVIVFKSPKNNLVMVKRVIGLPTDTIKMTDGRLVINERVISRKFTEKFLYRMRGNNTFAVSQFRERLPGSRRQHFIFERSDTGMLDNTEVFTVPENHVFVMGDHRDNSNDSRSFNGPGFIPLENIIGEVTHIMFQSEPCKFEKGIYCPPKRFMKKL